MLPVPISVAAPHFSFPVGTHIFENIRQFLQEKLKKEKRKKERLATLREQQQQQQ